MCKRIEQIEQYKPLIREQLAVLQLLLQMLLNQVDTFVFSLVVTALDLNMIGSSNS